MGKFCQFLTELPAPHTIVAVFYHFTFLYHGTQYVAGYYGIMLVVPVSSITYPAVLSFPDDDLSKCLWIFTKLGVCIDIVQIWLGIANVQI